MKKNDVRIGRCYMAKVTKSVVPVRIDAENAGGGWNGRNVATGRTVRIESAERLQRECTETDLAKFAKATAKKPKRQPTRGPKAAVTSKSKPKQVAGTSPRSATVAKPASKATKEATSKPAATRAKQGDTKPKKRKAKMSGLDAAAKVLGEAKEPMGAKQIVEVAFAKKYWHSKGQTPHATIYASIIREIAIKQKESRFRRVGRGKFEIAK